MPLPGVSAMNALVEPAFSVSRIITPAFAHTCVFDWLTTRAVTAPSPVQEVETKWNASVAFQMSAPAPCTVNVPLAWEEEPAAPVLPISVSVQVGGAGLLWKGAGRGKTATGGLARQP